MPGAEAQNLVRQARDAWLKQGHKYKKQGHKYNSSGEVDWSSSFPSVYMRTGPDDFWMDAVTGVMDRAKGEGLASLKVSSPCFLPPGKSKASGATPAGPAAFEAPSADDPATRRALAHSSRIYDALQVGSAPTQVATSTTGAVRVAVTTPATGPASAGV
ncbi:hypothetical protein OG592_32075 [Streptomyces avidinii]|uniref:hypothetical protein n=1 Tax=Streptomyces avidinii TaxID=1895 RepID=UPI00386AC6E5|nr:hypothetical protein OG592_32075 [Streptomyces avidinii]